MARKSAPFSHADYNRRYQQCAFSVRHGEVRDIGVLSAQDREYYDTRSYEERLDESDAGEAEVTWTDGKRSNKE